MRKRIFLALVFLTANQAEARRPCTILLGELSRKTETYNSYQERNQETLSELLKTETSCQEDGRSVSTKIASLASALSCQAEMDANNIDDQVRQIGARCTSRFTELHDFQKELHQKYDKVKADYEDGLEYIRKSEFLNRACEDEIQQMRSLMESYQTLEVSITTVQARALDGQTNYGKFRDTAQTLQAATGTRGRDCGQMASLVTGAVSAAAGGKDPVPVPSGLSPRTASDVTGKLESRLKESQDPNVKIDRSLRTIGLARRQLAARDGNAGGPASDITKDETLSVFHERAELGPEMSLPPLVEPRVYDPSAGSVIWKSHFEKEPLALGVGEHPVGGKLAAVAAPSSAPFVTAGNGSASPALVAIAPEPVTASVNGERISFVSAETTPTLVELRPAAGDVRSADLFALVSRAYRHSQQFRDATPITRTAKN